MVDPSAAATDSTPVHSEESILALDNVALELPVARIGSRVLAGFVDYLLLFFLAIAFFVVLLFVTSGLTELDTDLGMWWIAIVLLVMVATHWLYFAAQEILMDGRTLGKSLVGLRVVSRDGGKVGNGAIVLRTLVREIDILAGSLFMILDPLSRRVGDRLGGTLVVHDKAEEEVALGALPQGWGAREARVVEALLARSDELQPEYAQPLARRLLHLIHRCDPHFMEPEIYDPETGRLSWDPMTVLAMAFRRRG